MKTHTSQTTATHVEPFTSFIRATSKATRKAAFLLFSVAMLLGGGAATVRGQSALDGFDPNANGIVRIVVVQPDGKTLIGGDFTAVLGVTRNHIARLNPDGTLDTAFDPNADGNVLTFGVQTDGKVLAGGVFTYNWWADSQPYCPTRCRDRIGRFVRPQREQYRQFNFSAGGRHDSDRGRVHQYRRTDA